MCLNSSKISCLVCVLLVACGGHERENANVSQSPTLQGEAAPVADVGDMMAALKKIGIKIEVNYKYTNEDVRKRLFESMTKEWLMLKPKFDSFAAARRSSIENKENDSNAPIEIEIGNFWDLRIIKGKPGTLLFDGMTKLDKGTISPALKVARMLELSTQWSIKGTLLHLKFYPTAFDKEGCFSISNAKFDELVASISDMDNFAQNNKQLIESISIGHNNRYSKFDRELYLDPGSESFSEILKAIKNNDLKGLGKLVDE